MKKYIIPTIGVTVLAVMATLAAGILYSGKKNAY